MSADLSVLDREFRKRIDKVLDRCLRDGYPMVPYVALRDPWEQARLYRQSRTTATIEHVIAHLEACRAPFIASIVRDVGPQPVAPEVTRALPGQSYHQWGLAVDCYARRDDGRADWNSGSPGYQVYAQHALDLGLEPGFFWLRPDAVHVQARKGRVLDTYTWPEIDAAMKARYGT